jgi:hypothetical protein
MSIRITTWLRREALRAFRGVTLLGFEILRSSHGFFPQFLVEVSEEDVQAKLEALACYKHMRINIIFRREIIKSTLLRNGAIAERPYAEGFEVLRLVGRFGSLS